jgi:hypothetical protein
MYPRCIPAICNRIGLILEVLGYRRHGGGGCKCKTISFMLHVCSHVYQYRCRCGECKLCSIIQRTTLIAFFEFSKHFIGTLHPSSSWAYRESLVAGKKQVCIPLQEHVIFALLFILSFLPTSKRGFLVSSSYRHSGHVHVLASQGTTQERW